MVRHPASCFALIVAIMGSVHPSVASAREPRITADQLYRLVEPKPAVPLPGLTLLQSVFVPRATDEVLGSIGVFRNGRPVASLIVSRSSREVFRVMSDCRHAGVSVIDGLKVMCPGMQLRVSNVLLQYSPAIPRQAQSGLVQLLRILGTPLSS